MHYATILGALAIVLGGVVFCVRALWNIRGAWDQTNAELRILISRVADIVERKDQDHARMEEGTAEVSRRLERHLEWHDKH